MFIIEEIFILIQNHNPMEKLLNDQMSDIDVLDYPEKNKLVMTKSKKSRDIELEIEIGNLKDYLETYGDLE